MASEARAFFTVALDDVANLMWFHENEGGGAPGKRAAHFGSLNKSAIVLLCAAWESYIEFVICEAADRNIQYAASPDAMLKSLKKLVGSHVRDGKDESTWQLLAGDGWKNLAKSVVRAKVGSLNTPKSHQITELMSSVLDVRDICANWTWHKNPVGVPSAKLNDFVKLRGAIAHGEKLSFTVTKAQVTTAQDLLERLVDIVEARLINEGLIP